MAASPLALIETVVRSPAIAPLRTLTDRQIAEFSGVFRGRELTRKDRRLSSGIAALDVILGGGIARLRLPDRRRGLRAGCDLERKHHRLEHPD